MVLLVSSFSYTKKAYKETPEQMYRNGLNRTHHYLVNDGILPLFKSRKHSDRKIRIVGSNGDRLGIYRVL